MTTATVDIGLDLDWVTFTDGDRPACCTFGPFECDERATHVAYFALLADSRDCEHLRKPYCLAHAKLIISRDNPSYWAFHCAACPGSHLRLIRMEPLR